MAKHAGRFVVFDLKSSLPYLKGLEGAAEEKCFDSIVAAYLLNPLKNDYGFEDVAQEHLGLMIDPKTELEKWSVMKPMLHLRHRQFWKKS